MRRSLSTRFWEKVEKSDDCWIWTGSKTAGYGTIRIGDTVDYAHRVSYRMHHGSVPHGLVIDHLCRVPACVNPGHLEAVTQRVNVRRGTAGWNTAARTHCPSDHEYTEENTKWYRVKTGWERKCLECKRKHARETARRRRETAKQLDRR